MNHSAESELHCTRPGGGEYWTRRLFVAHAAACVSVAAMPLPIRAADTEADPGIRIRALRLKTSQPIDVMTKFYRDTIGFSVTSEADDSVTLETGESTITFDYAADIDAFYHFAFNIPENQIRSAHEWQKQRSELITPPERLVDEGMPREVVAFRHWNAHSVFFWDPAGNAVEYIARHDLDNGRAGEFSIESVLGLSEIGLVAEDVPAVAKRVRDSLSVKTYVSASEAFEPIGDPHGLLLIMKAGATMAFGQGGKRGIYPTEVRLARSTPIRLTLAPYPYELHAPSER